MTWVAVLPAEALRKLNGWGASGRNGAYPVAHGAIPVSATVVLDAPRATTGQCGRATFPGPPPAPSCRFNATGSTLTCR